MCAKKKLLSFNLELFSQSTKIKSNNRNFTSTMKLRIPPEPEEAIKIKQRKSLVSRNRATGGICANAFYFAWRDFSNICDFIVDSKTQMKAS